MREGERERAWGKEEDRRGKKGEGENKTGQREKEKIEIGEILHKKVGLQSSKETLPGSPCF